MASKRQLPILTLMCLMSVFGLPNVTGWSNGGYSSDTENPDFGTHDWIAETALTIQVRDVSFLTSTYHSEFLIGTEAPDNPDYIGDTTKHHVYFYSSGEVQDDICALRASQIYKTALEYLNAGDYHSAAYDIGVLAHYVADVAVFGHTMGTYTDWGSEVHHSDYEDEVDSRLGTLSLPAGTALGDSSAYAATMDLARAVTFGNGSIKPNIWMEENYDWADTQFVSSAIASVYASVAAVAAVVNHLMLESGQLGPTPPTANAPGAPDSLTASVDGTRVTLTWSPPSDDGGSSVTGYKIYRGTDTVVLREIASLTASVTSWVDDDVTEGMTYHYGVAATNSVGTGEMALIPSVAIPDESRLPLMLMAFVAASASAAIGLGYAVTRKRKRS